MEENKFCEEFETRTCSVARNLRMIRVYILDEDKKNCQQKINNVINKNADALPLVKYSKL